MPGSLSRRTLANAIRVLSMDAVQKANSGHPGMPMGMADIAEVLWCDFLQHNPTDPSWVNRDRFILSNGHGSMLHYSLLHLTGYDLPLEQLKQFRQLHSKTAGHPEYRVTPGVETTTGPLGQGLTNAVGMALAERTLAATFNRPHHTIVDHFTYVFLGDGCLMEGISHEACSLAGTLALGKLIAFWDDNKISIDGHVEGWFTDDTPARFRAYGWHVIANVDGHDSEAIHKAILEARSVNDKPSLICCRTVIGFGAPNLAGSHDCHGAALGDVEIAATRLNLDWSHVPFEIPADIYQAWDARTKGQQHQAAWQQRFNAYQKAYPELASEFLRRTQGELPANFDQQLPIMQTALADKAMASRKASQECLNLLGPVLPELLGGSADLTGSNLTNWKGSVALTHTELAGNYIHYGVREFAMSAIMNGIALHGGFIPYGGGFLVFADYARNAVRLAALMKQRVIFVYTHDSIGLGEDGPTHQPIEHLAMLRLTPQLSLWRPADAVETAAAWCAAIQHQGPTCLVLSRQTLPALPHTETTRRDMRRGAYVLWQASTDYQVIIMATGSEVALALTAAQQLANEGILARVVSMSSVDVFEQQPADYKDSVLPADKTQRVAIEAAATGFWYKYVGLNGRVIGMDTFGESAPGNALFKYFGFTVENVTKLVRDFTSPLVGEVGARGTRGG